jgi:hypothetical protein
LNTFGVAGAAGVGPDAIGVLGYGASTTHANLALTGYDVGPGSVAAVGYAAYPEPGAGPGSTQTTGVLGIAPDGIGVMGQTSVYSSCCPEPLGSQASYAGVVGVDASTNYGYNAGVVGKTGNGEYGVEGIAGTDAFGGVEGLAGNGDGVDGYSAVANGLFGFSPTGYGVVGASNSGYGGYFTGGGGYPALYASNSSSGDGIDASTATGVAGVSGSGTNEGVRATGNYIALFGKAGVAGAFPFVLVNESNSDLFFVDDSGDLYVHGTVNSFVSTRSGAVGRMFTSRSTMQTMEDFGSGTVVNGTGSVRLDPSFAQMIDGGGYQVFLTPNGDNRGLYVTEKTPGAFVVRESQGGHSTLAFDYRIVARQYGHTADRASLAASAAAFGEPNATTPALLHRAPSSAVRSRRHAATSAASQQNTFAIPRAAAGLMQNFGH